MRRRRRSLFCHHYSIQHLEQENGFPDNSEKWLEHLNKNSLYIILCYYIYTLAGSFSTLEILHSLCVSWWWLIFIDFPSSSSSPKKLFIPFKLTLQRYCLAPNSNIIIHLTAQESESKETSSRSLWCKLKAEWFRYVNKNVRYIELRVKMNQKISPDWISRQ